MKDFIKNKLKESLINEKMMLKDWDLYIQLVAEAYLKAPNYDPSVIASWNALNQSNHTLFNRILSKVKIVFITTNIANVGSIEIDGRVFEVKFSNQEDEYKTQSEMKTSFEKTGILKISMDYSEHPIFSVKDNIVFRSVHDYIAHILGNYDFGAKGEIACYNLHAKMAPNAAIPALFTEVVGQAATTIVTGSFPTQKITLLKGFDYKNIGLIDDENYTIINKELILKSEINKGKIEKPKDRTEPVAIFQKKEEPELELSENTSTQNLGKIDTSKIRIKKQEVNGLLVFSPYYEGQKMGSFRLKPQGNDYKIFGTVLYDRFRGQGIGKGMYKYIIRTLGKEGKHLYSDKYQSADAVNVWNSLIKAGLAKTTDNGFVSI